MWRNFQTAFFIVALLWLIHIVNYITPLDFRSCGLWPRHMEGLRGIVTAPFLHGDFRHLAANSGALLILLVLSISYSRRRTWTALISIILIGGGLTWLFGSSAAIHIGASGVIFGLIGFLLFSGIFRRDAKSLIAALCVLLLYGGSLYSLTDFRPGISWSSHFFGFMAGIAAAWNGRRSQHTV